MTPQSSAAGSAGIGVVGSIMSGIALREQGIQEQRAYDYNADVALVDASNAIVSSEQRFSALVGKQATAYAAAGVDITRGSPLLMMAATAGRGGREAEQIYQAGSEKATLDRYYGKIAAWRGTMSGVGAFLKGLSTSATDYLKATGYQPGDSNSSGSDSRGVVVVALPIQVI